MRGVSLQQEIVIRTEDRVGVLADVSRLLADMGINLLAVCVDVNGEDARVRLVTSSQSYAREALCAAGFHVEERDVVVIELPHHPGFLCRVSEALARKGITIEDLYATVSDDAPTGVVVFACSNNSWAIQLLHGR
jgi:hypothetical protein